MSLDADVIVVGAGCSGLSAARALRGKSVRVIVLEARDRVGGRTLTVSHNGSAVDLGGQWFGPTQTFSQALIKHFGLKLHPQFDEGRHILELGGKMLEYSGNISELSMFARLG